MGQWLATVEFPDGTRRYGTYSTVTERLLELLYSRMCPAGGTLADGSTCVRAQPVGEPDEHWPDAEPAPLADLVPVVISVEPDGHSWHALFCPARAVVLGPVTGQHVEGLQRRFELVADDDGVRHLRRAIIEVPHGGQVPSAACGRVVPAEPQPFYTPWRADGGIGYEDVPGIDLYARWRDGDVCRECLVSQLPDVESDPGQPGG